MVASVLLYGLIYRTLSLHLPWTVIFECDVVLKYCTVTAECPTVLDCIKFQGRKRTINIPREIGSNYSQFGILLLNDPNGTRVSNIEDKHRRDAVQINTEILREWATGRGKQPVSWEILTEVLCNIGFGALASEIKVIKSTSTIP